MALLAVLIGILTIAIVLNLPKDPVKPNKSVSVNPPPAPGATSPAPEPASVPSPPVPPSTPVATPQNCTPSTGLISPSPIVLTNRPSGLTQVIDAPLYYRIYGDTSAQIRAQIQQCAPDFNREGTKFAAATDYSLSWKYSTTVDNAGLCKITDVKIGLHTSIMLPQWQPTSSTTNGLANAWQKFITSLTTHENEHVAIDQQNAGQLVSTLLASPVADCGSIPSVIQAKVEAAKVAIGVANNAYDARTNHGASQGAVIP